MTTKKSKREIPDVLAVEPKTRDEFLISRSFQRGKEYGYVEGLVQGIEEGREQGIAMERSRIRQVEWTKLAVLMAGISFSMTLAAIVAAYWITKI